MPCFFFFTGIYLTWFATTVEPPYKTSQYKIERKQIIDERTPSEKAVKERHRLEEVTSTELPEGATICTKDPPPPGIPTGRDSWKGQGRPALHMEAQGINPLPRLDLQSLNLGQGAFPNDEIIFQEGLCIQLQCEIERSSR